MRKLLFILGLVSAVELQAQVVIQPGALVKTTGDVSIVFNNINVVNNDATSDFSGSILSFTGSTNTLLSGNGNWNLRKIILDKSSGMLQLESAIQVSQQLQVISGKLDLNTQVVTLLQDAQLTGENGENRVVGPNGGHLQTTVALSMPVSQNPGGLGAIITSNSNLGNVTVKRWHNGTASDGKIQRYYEVTPTNNIALHATLRLHYLDAELGGLSEQALTIYKRTNSTDAWVNVGGDTKDSSLNFVEKTGINSFNQLTIGAATAGPLPLKWGSAGVKCVITGNEIKWSTIQEENVQHFLVQKSTNGTDWETITSVLAKGNSNTQQAYSFIDPNSTHANVFYRISSIDFDGKKSYSAIIPFRSCGETMDITVSPVPALHEAIVRINTSKRHDAELQLIGSDGKLYKEQQLNLQPGLNQVPLNVQQLGAGVYYVLLQTSEGTIKRSLIKR